MESPPESNMTACTTARTLRATVIVALAALATSGPVPARAEIILTQPPCVSHPDDFCLTFGPNGAVPNIRTRSFTAPAAGKAIATFHGSVVCVNLSGVKGGLQLESQIVDRPSATPSPAKPGGLMHTGTLPPEGRWVSNLASTRVFSVPSAGDYTYIFKIHRSVLTPTTTECRVYNAAFTIEFKPTQ
jgi:hypothetical protein